MKMNRYVGLLITFFLIMNLLSLYALLILKYDYMSIKVPAVSVPSVMEFSGWESPRQERAVTAGALGVLLEFFIFDERGQQITFMVFCANLLLLFYMVNFLYASGRIKRLADLTDGGDEVLLTEEVVRNNVLRTLSVIEAVYEARMNLKIYRRGIVINNRLKLLEGCSVPEVLNEIRETITTELRDHLGIVAPVQVTNKVVSLVKVTKKSSLRGNAPAPTVPPPSPSVTASSIVSSSEVKEDREKDRNNQERGESRG